MPYVPPAGSASPLTTKGDIYTFDTANARLPVGADGTVLSADSTQITGLKYISAGGTGTVTSVSVATANGFSGTVANATTTPAITIIAGAITPTTVNSVTISGSSTPTLAVTGTSSISGANTGDQTITLTGVVTGSGTGSFATAIQSSIALPGSPTTTTQSAGDNSTKIATDAFVTTAINNAIAGVNPAVAVQAATTSASNTSGLTYNNGVSGVGATFTGSNNTALTFDGYTFTALGQRALVKNDTQAPSGAFNGIYYVTQIQTAILPPILTRALDYDQSSDINNTGAIPVVNGTVNGTTSWVLTSAVNTVGTDPLTYTQFTLNPTTIATSSNNLSFFAATTSAQLAGVISDETGSGVLVFATSPTLVTPALGTPASGVMTNVTGTASSLTVGAANAVNSATTTVNTNSATAPSSGQVLTATSSTAATWQTPASGLTWSVVTSTTQTAAVNNGYFANNAGLVTVTLPSTAAVGSTVSVAWMGAGGWKLAQAASVQIQFGNKTTTSGTGGSLASSAAGDVVTLVCQVANTGWTVVNSIGNITVT